MPYSALVFTMTADDSWAKESFLSIAYRSVDEVEGAFVFAFNYNDPISHPALAPKIYVNFNDAKAGFGKFFNALNLNPVENNFRTLISKATALPIVPPPLNNTILLLVAGLFEF